MIMQNVGGGEKTLADYQVSALAIKSGGLDTPDASFHQNRMESSLLALLLHARAWYSYRGEKEEFQTALNSFFRGKGVQL